jgi:hypothetical protein
MDLKNILQSGVNPKTGEYMSSEERKKAFRKALGRDQSSRKIPTDGAGDDPNGALVKQHNFKVISQLIELKKVSDKLRDTKQKRVRLESKFANAQRKYDERKLKDEEESKMESGRVKSGKNIFKTFATKAAAEVGGGLLGILGSLITYGILDWISKPENKNQVETMVHIFKGLFKVFDFFISAMVGNTMDGFFKLFGGGSILERIFGFFQLAFGLFMFKGFVGRLLNPLQIIKDIGWIIKNAGKFSKLFGALSSKNFTKAFDTLKSIFPKTLSIFKQSFGKSVKRLMLKIFGKGITKLIGPLLGKATKFLLKPLAVGAKRIPIIGGILSVPINMFLGDPIDKAVFKGLGSTLGAIAVGALGSIIPGAGTVLGAAAGGLLGETLGGWLYDVVVPPLKGIFANKQPELNTGGIASGPDSGYPVTLHGVEAVIPITKLAESILSPYKEVASMIMGATLAVLKSMGPIGSIMGPVALQMFNPFIRVFGLSVQTFSSGLGRGVNLIIPSAAAKEFDGSVSKEEKIEENIKRGKRKTGSGRTSDGDKDTGNVDASGIEAATGSVVDKGVSIARKFMSNLSLTKESAAAIAGNFAHESAGFIPGIREGGPFGRSSKPWPKGTVGSGYGWAQWTNSVPGDRYDKFIESYGGDYNKIPTNEDNFKFAVKEMRSTNKLSDNFKKMNDVAAATVWFRKNWERAGVHHDEPRIKYAKGILAKLAAGGQVKSATGEGRTKGQETKGSSANHTYLTKLDDKNIKKAYAPVGMCVTGSLNTMQNSGVPNPAATGNDVGNNPRGAAVQLIRNFGWQSIGGSNTTLKSPYGTVTTGVFNKSDYAKAVDAGKIPSGSLIFQTRHPDWNGTSPGSRGFDMAIAQRKGRSLWNGQSLGQWVYGNTKHVIALSPGGKPGDGISPGTDSPESPTLGDPSSSDDTKRDEPYAPTDLDINTLKDLFMMLNPNFTSSNTSTTPAPKPPEPVTPSLSSPTPSQLPDMSKTFTLDKKINQINPVVRPTSIVVNAQSNITQAGIVNTDLNTMSISETANLNKL